MWLKKKILPLQKSFNVETINFTQKSIKVALLGSRHPVGEELELQSQVQMSLLLRPGTRGWTAAWIGQRQFRQPPEKSDARAGVLRPVLVAESPGAA